MAEKTWRGIQVNFNIFQGEIIEDPTIVGEHIFLTLRTVYLARDNNGQFVEMDQNVPLLVEPEGPTNVARNYIKKGRKLVAWCHYKSWNTDQGLQHAFVAKRFDLGDKPYVAPDAPPLPQ